MAKPTKVTAFTPYQGNKSRFAGQIASIIGPALRQGEAFVDGCCGTGVVSETRPPASSSRRTDRSVASKDPLARIASWTAPTPSTETCTSRLG